MTKHCDCRDVSENRRTHHIRSIGWLRQRAISEGGEGAVSEFGRVVLRVEVQLDSCETRPNLSECASDRSGSKDGVDPFTGDGCVQHFGHLLYPREDIFGSEMAEGQWRTDENRVCALWTRGDGEDEIQGRVGGGVVSG